MASLFDVFGRLLLEGDQQFVAEAAKAGKRAGEASGKAMGGSLSSTLKATVGTGFKVLASGAALALGAATKGALQLEDATARYRAETGATAEEAERAGKAINRVAGDQRMSLEAVTDIAIRVKRDLGAVGEEADRLTDRFALFARVTRQDAAGSVEAFDDILDSWGLDASRTGEVMDKLLVSQQRFGGSIQDTQRTLAALAPAMRAANMELDDGIALLGLFGSKGLDANAASAAFAKALTKVKSPAELQALIDDISATTDPFKRAAKAADLFGARAGAKLANALGGVRLDDYAISMDDAAGATERAGEALDSTFSAQIAKKISQVGAAVRGFGADLGPALTGAAALASLGGALGLDKVLSKGWTAAGNSGAVKKAIALVGGKSATLYLTALIAGDRLQAALAGAWDKLPVTGAKAAGTKAGAAFTAGVTLGLVALVGVVAKAITDNVVAPFQDAQVAKLIAQGNIETLRNARRLVELELQSGKLFGFLDFDPFGLKDGAKANAAQLDAAIEQLSTRAKDAWVGDMSAGGKLGAQGFVDSAASGIAGGEPEVTAAAGEMTKGIGPVLLESSTQAYLAGQETPQQMADGIRSKRDMVTGAMSALTDALANAMSPAKERAQLIGQLTGEEIAKGLRSKDPAVRAQAVATREVLLNRLRELVPANGVLGKRASAELAKALKSKDPAVRAAAKHVKDIVNDKLRETATGAAAAGARTGTAFISAIKRVVSASGAVTVQFRQSGINSIGGKARGGPVLAGVPTWVGEEGKEIFIPEVDGHVLNHTQSMAASSGASAVVQPDWTPGGDTYNVPLHVTGVLRAETPGDLVRPLLLAARTGALSNPRRRRHVAVPTRA